MSGVVLGREVLTKLRKGLGRSAARAAPREQGCAPYSPARAALRGSVVAREELYGA